MCLSTNLCYILGLVSLIAIVNGGNFGQYVVDDSVGYARRFDGIGAISGGGATSKLLMNYDPELRNQILDFLFKPNFGASLHILKVEIGGDSQSTDGVEASHMHSADEENYQRGYEWFMMKEARKRNPDIKLYGLPWVFPGWVGGGKFDIYSNKSELVRYVTNWVKGARNYHNLTIDYLGIWNERRYDTEYIKMLRKALDQYGFPETEIVVADGGWGVYRDIEKDPGLLSSVGVIGAHYPGSHSPIEALALDRPLWASEEYSAFNDLSGGGCWARALCESYVNGHLTGVIAWNLITSYYLHLPYTRASLMVANEPWSGNYNVSSPIWATAHYTQFMKPGWRYLQHGVGVGNLTNNGSYITLGSPDGKDFTMVIETLSPITYHCFYHMPKYTIANQTANFVLKGSLRKIEQLYAWYSYYDFTKDYKTSNKTVFFKNVDPVNVKDGTFTLDLPINTIYTLTTLAPPIGNKGSYPDPPSSKPFPTEYSDDFEGYSLNAEAYNLAQQAGSFEVVQTNDVSHGKVIQQMVPQPPVDTCRPKRMTRPAIVFGDFNWHDVSVQVDFKLDSTPDSSSGVYLAARVASGGCNLMYAKGLWVWASASNNTITLTGNHTRSFVYAEVAAKISTSKWHTIKLTVKQPLVTVTFDQTTIINMTIPLIVSHNGFLAMGTETFAKAYFDNLKIMDAKIAKFPVKEQFNMNLEKRVESKNLDSNEFISNHIDRYWVKNKTKF